MRLQRREGVGGDPRPGRAQPAQQGRLARVRRADQPGVGDQAQLQPHAALPPGLPQLRDPRRAVRGAAEERVAVSAAAAPRQQDALPVGGEVGQLLNGLVIAVDGAGDRAHRHLQQEVGAVAAAAFVLAAWLAGVGAERGRPPVATQGVDLPVRDQDHVPAAAAAAAVRAALRDELLAVKRDGAVAAVPADDLNRRLIDHDPSIWSAGLPPGCRRFPPSD